MNDLPRQKLKEIIIQYGRSLCDEPQRCEGLLRDLCGQYQKEIAVLVGALKERVPADLLASQNSTPAVVFLARLTKKLQDNLGLTEEAARWAVESWALALGVISEADTAPVDSSSPPPQVPPQYRQENVNQIPVTSNNSSSLPNNIVPRKETDTAAENILGLKKANNQIKPAWITGTILGVINLLVTLFLNNPYVFIDVVLYFVLSFGIYKKSRICAVIMLGYYIASRIFFWEVLKGNPLVLIVSIAFIYFLWQGVQGTFAYHKITKM
ncbi:MAG: hypothetical protein EWV53_01420 [Microcystis panniformis Mp_MB_F_20051200_S9]|uniref:Uncharacterized protein n=1 Tax=Microcystis panniformis Mp_MB_F_20051200_S9 TaxID=2486223 RepID=A0A552QAK0_9CHRO|nr:MAG: hypothetical protein EWV43_12915 [Microcystis panniformis Mp_MB_F_20080800_S26D]TRV47859.1 MAG: hypothetical protein EWV87_13355 [Microcystis panniformis Mp_GB_SS_20050300_S99]TRV52674.1 MAG: hypothetical protein EWV42_07580 [Microcystis panniformis Mp_GB_SS_20050300_S99D]TRV57395.1 MAG: hypothetical protein EWV69_16145 [Microcystis panniformis Mp_MB_F_20080800_S26]TRV66234.1 MAG: hypothetical protein EWV53_01420 [Microcystis panniformis Mp_MB_F_20051200_S9]TRV68133.1 MAG: hypothetical